MSRNKKLTGIQLIRFLAILSILVFHINPDLMPGGFLGVDLFFVMSGYLLMNSLNKMEEEEIKVKNCFSFIRRRLKKLLLPLAFMVGIVLLILFLFNRELFNSSFKDGIFGVLLLENWWLIFRKVDYFDSFAVSPFKHLWYLAVQEQFALLLILLYFFIRKMTKSKDQTKKYLRAALLGISILSLLLHIGIFEVDKISRVYYGTDTRMFALAIGALANTYLDLDHLRRPVKAGARLFIALPSLALLIIYLVSIFTISEFSLFLYQGGFFIVAILSAAFILLMARPGNLLTSFLTNALSMGIANISYSLYLWHFPILTITQFPSELDGPSLGLTLLRLFIILILSVLSYLILESRKLGPFKKLGAKPPHTREIGDENIVRIRGAEKDAQESRKELSQKKIDPGQWIEMLTITTTSLALILLVVFSQRETKRLDQQMAYENALSQAGQRNVEISRQIKENPVFLTIQKIDHAREAMGKTHEGQVEELEAKKERDQKASQAMNQFDTIVVIGDSLALDMGGTFRNKYPQAIIDGEVGRQMYESAEVASQYQSYDSPTNLVIFQLGANGLFREDHMEELIAMFPQSQICFVNVKANVGWEDEVNQIIERVASRYERVHIIDWYSLASDHPEYFASDQVHIMQVGVNALIRLIEESVLEIVDLPA